MYWLNLGDDNTRLFFAKSKQRKMATFIYSLKDINGTMVEGFNNVGKVLLQYYEHLLGPQQIARTSIDMEELFKEGSTSPPHWNWLGKLEYTAISGSWETKAKSPGHYTKEIWGGISHWWDFPGNTVHLHDLIHSMLNIKGKVKASISYAIFAAGVYYIWRARNVAPFKQTQWATPSVVKEIKEQIKTRILFLHSISAKYSLYIDRLLSI
ncbi:hypothetical protein Cgig2_023654 [Carnegiea gigantea]|uniref:Uncharacterized protein n=1 Tax=Carnegiea gigantea TaxID=171969 RepID=A0A9Q1JHU9_9CARY|nr:hypothetical protein Cgig2_023654 [Carnegiea gigantea]